MTQSGQGKLRLFADNSQVIKKEFTWQNTLTRRLAALLYAQQGKTADCAAIRSCHDLIKQNTGLFSTFRGNMALCVATLLSLSPQPRELFDATLRVYGLLKDAKFHASDFLVVAAYQIAALSGATEYGAVVARTRDFYEEMKAHHFFLTGQDDYIFAAMLGLTGSNAAAVAERMERLHSRLKGEFWDKNSVQTLTQVLVLSHSDDSAAERVLVLRDALRAQKIKLDQAYTLPILGILALLPVDTGTMVSDLGAAQDMLRAQKGFGSLSVTTQELLLFAASIIADDYTEDVKNGALTAALSTSITNIIIAQQTAMIAAISASSAAAASS